tara:strand:+ start:273 stop:563 length:291 start_codon:yes stop_codon:yes gene_type:complete
MKRVDDLLKYLEGYSDIAVVNKAKIHQELLLIKKEVAAINYTHSCTELKDKKVLTFSQYIKCFDFKPLGNKQYLRGITTLGFDVVREKYLDYTKNL